MILTFAQSNSILHWIYITSDLLPHKAAPSLCSLIRYIWLNTEFSIYWSDYELSAISIFFPMRGNQQWWNQHLTRLAWLWDEWNSTTASEPSIPSKDQVLRKISLYTDRRILLYRRWCNFWPHLFEWICICCYLYGNYSWLVRNSKLYASSYPKNCQHCVMLVVYHTCFKLPELNEEHHNETPLPNQIEYQCEAVTVHNSSIYIPPISFTNMSCSLPPGLLQKFEPGVIALP